METFTYGIIYVLRLALYKSSDIKNFFVNKNSSRLKGVKSFGDFIAIIPNKKVITILHKNKDTFTSL